MSKKSCKEMTLFEKHKGYLRAINERINYLEEKAEMYGSYTGYTLKECAALKYSRELIQKQLLVDARAVVQNTLDEDERKICRKFLEKWG